jgi:hypothetical protein
MNFLYPGFLFALTAVAIPVLIHLFNFRKYTKVQFSSIQFLKEVKERDASKEKLKDLLILLSRILAIIFLVFAFSRPYLSSKDAVDPGKALVVRLYIDNSFSMESVNKDGSLLDEAKRRAKEIAGSYGPNTKFQLMTNDFLGKHQRLVSYEELMQLLDEVKISAVYRTLDQVLSRQAAQDHPGFNHQDFLISDFQSNFTGSKALKSAGPVSLVKLNPNVLPNIAIDSVWFLSAVHRPQDTEKLVVRLRNYTAEPARGLPLKLMIANTQKAAHTLEIPAHGVLNDTLSFGGLQLGWQKGTLSIKDYPVTFDDVLNFTFQVDKERKILNIKGNVAEKYISTLFVADPYFKVTEMPESNIRYTSFSDFDLIVLNELKEPSSGLAGQLNTYLQQGGTVVLFPDLNVSPVLYSSFLKSLSLPEVSGLSVSALTVDHINLGHEIFRGVFEQVPKNIDLPKVNRFFSYKEQNRVNKQNIMELPPKQLFFAEYIAGQGKLYLSATSVDIKDSNLPEHPVFVPLMYKIALSNSRKQPLYYTIGSSDLLEHEKIVLKNNQFLRLFSENFEAIPELRQTPGKSLLYIADQVKKPGFYELKKTDSLLAIYAFNDDRRESEMQYASDEGLRKIFPDHQVRVYQASKEKLNFGSSAKNNSTDLWKLCLVLCAVFLAVEVLLIRFFNHTKNIQKT